MLLDITSPPVTRARARELARCTNGTPTHPLSPLGTWQSYILRVINPKAKLHMDMPVSMDVLKAPALWRRKFEVFIGLGLEF